VEGQLVQHVVGQWYEDFHFRQAALAVISIHYGLFTCPFDRPIMAIQ
jgi:hypothetical protein